MRDAVLLVAGAVLGVAASAVFFQGTPQPWFRRLRGRLRASARRLAPATASTWETDGALMIGDLETSWYSLDGDGRAAWAAPAGRIHVDLSATCPADARFADLLDDVETERKAELGTGVVTDFDTLGIAITNLVISRTDHDEEIASTAEAVPASYLQFRAKLRGLAGPTPRAAVDEILPRAGDPTSFSPFLLSHAGVAVAVITSDHQLVVARRKPFGPRPGELDCSVVEGINLHLDRSTHDRSEIVAANVMRRGLAEELGVMPDDVRSCEVLTVGVDVKYAQWNWTGVARIGLTGDQVRTASRHAADRFENQLLELVDFAPGPVLARLNGERIWGCGLATIYAALVFSFGRRAVDREAAKLGFATT